MTKNTARIIPVAHILHYTDWRLLDINMSDVHTPTPGIYVHPHTNDSDFIKNFSQPWVPVK